MNDRTITRASRQGARTQPIQHKPADRAAPRTREEIFTPEIMAAELERARTKRLAEDLAAYAQRKRTP